MPLPKNLDPYTSPRAFYGAELRRLRETAGLSQEHLGERAFCSGGYICQLESATRRPQLDLSKLFDALLDSGEHFQRLCRLARQSPHPDYFADAAELEKQAKTISEYSPMLVPGFLQTEAYARALTRATMPLAPDEEIEGHVQARMARGRLLDGAAAPLLWEIIHESALRVPVGGTRVMRDQLAHIVERSHDRRGLVQVHPYSAGAHSLMLGLTSLMTFADAPAVAYVETGHSGQLIDDPALVAHCQSSYDLARAAALSPEASLALLESTAKDYKTP